MLANLKQKQNGMGSKAFANKSVVISNEMRVRIELAIKPIAIDTRHRYK